jgi:phosphohistidine phosphatase
MGVSSSQVSDNRGEMMETSRHLFLLRHAKSSWDEPELADHDRPLAPRGRKAAKLISAYLRREQIGVALVLCSSAGRARETLDLVAPPGELHIERDLYGASAHELLERLRRVPDEDDAVMLIGHEPAMRDLAICLIGGGGELAERKFPTAALATLTFTGPWSALGPKDAVLASFITPRELG